MTNKNFISLLIIIAIVWLGFDIGSGKIRWGTAYLNDSSSSVVSLNKGFRINGDASIKNTFALRMGTASANAYLSGVSSDIYQNATTHYFRTTYDNTILTMDSLTGLSMSYGDFILDNDNYIREGPNAPYIQTKLIRFKLSGSTSTTTTASHGLTYGKIIDVGIIAREDSAATELIVKPDYATATYNYTAFVDSTVCSATTGGSAAIILNDSVFFYITYHK